jgi:hypothetical protein
METIKSVHLAFSEKPVTRDGQDLLNIMKILPATYFGFRAANLAHQNGMNLGGIIASTIGGVMLSAIATSLVPSIAYTSPIWVSFAIVKIHNMM